MKKLNSIETGIVSYGITFVVLVACVFGTKYLTSEERFVQSIQNLQSVSAVPIAVAMNPQLDKHVGGAPLENTVLVQVEPVLVEKKNIPTAIIIGSQRESERVLLRDNVGIPLIVNETPKAISMVNLGNSLELGNKMPVLNARADSSEFVRSLIGPEETGLITEYGYDPTVVITMQDSLVNTQLQESTPEHVYADSELHALQNAEYVKIPSTAVRFKIIAYADTNTAVVNIYAIIENKKHYLGNLDFKNKKESGGYEAIMPIGFKKGEDVELYIEQATHEVCTIMYAAILD